MTHKTDIPIQIPELDDLCCINCKVKLEHVKDSLVKSLFHGQILMCRLIIYTVRCCIASPSIQNVGDLIHVIVSKKFYSTGKLQSHLEDLKLEFTDSEPVHLKIYEACLKYTFTFKVAPFWNLIGKSFYVHGFNFLSLPSNIDAVEWNIVFKDNNAHSASLEIIPMKINLIPFTLESLSLPSHVIDDFFTNSTCTKNSINLSIFHCPWIYVLPKLTRARILSVSKTLPEICPFENYNALRRHWKNMYSYRLPKTDQGMLFYEVVFPINPSQHFVYPEPCILFKPPEFLMCEDKSKVAKEFLKDLTSNVRYICDQPLKIGHLYPELDIEYSCIVKKRINSSSQKEAKNVQLTSPFFKTPNNHVVRSKEKSNLSSIFTYQGLNQMSEEKKKYNQQILSIMENRHPKKRPLTEKSNQYITPTKFRGRGRKCDVAFNISKNLENNYLSRQKEQVTDDSLDIYSYYDLPYMNPEHSDTDDNDYSLKKEDVGIIKQNLISNLPNFNQQNNKPTIKKIENVCINLDNLKKIKTNQINTYFANLHQNNNQNFENSVTKTPFNLQHISVNCNEYSENQNKYCPEICENKKVSQEFDDSSSKFQDKFLKSPNKEDSYKIRHLLSNFDSYNIHENDNMELEKTIHNQILIKKKLKEEHCNRNIDKKLCESTDKPLLNTLSKELKSEQFSENFMTDIHMQPSERDYQNDLNFKHRKNSLDLNKSSSYKSEPDLFTNSLDLNKSNSYKSEPDIFSGSEDFLSSSNIKANTSINQKSKISNYNYCCMNQNENNIISPSQHSPILSSSKNQNENLSQNNQFNENADKKNLDISLSPDLFNSDDEIKKQILQNSQFKQCNMLQDINELNSLDLGSSEQKNNYNFLDILSESSNESDNKNYEVYKETCRESLTFGTTCDKFSE